MGKIRRGNCIFVSWIGDHGHHVHVFRGGRLLVKWDLARERVISGKMSPRILGLIRELRKEGRL